MTRCLTTQNRRTVLHFAACYSNTNMVELLWKKAADEEATKEIDEVDEVWLPCSALRICLI